MSATRSYRDLIEIQPERRGGRPCLRGTRIAVADVLGWLADGQTEAEIAADFPEIGREQVRACLSHADYRGIG
jgi:uncharacterized protein (DUF433 family)